MNDFDFNITIVGLGLIGGSYAMALKKLNKKAVWGIDINIESLKQAKDNNIIDEGYVDAKIPLENSDIVICCLYPHQTINFVKENMKYFKNGALITDACGIKEKVVEEINKCIREDLEFIGAHPMAGKECSGYDNATDNLFNNANFIITPLKNNTERNINKVKEIGKRLGCGKIVLLSPKEHDNIIAFTSQLPHIIATALISSCSIENVGLYTGGSFEDATRVACINSKLWTELMMSNRGPLIKHIKLFEKYIDNIKNSLIEKSENDLCKCLDEGSKKKVEEINGKING